MTSRRERDIQLVFGKSEFHTVEVEAKQVDADIATYVRHMINHRTEEENLCGIDQALKDKIEQALVTRSGGM